MALQLATDAHTFLKQLLDCSDKDKDTLITEWDDELAELHPHACHVLLIGTPPTQKVLHCITYEVINLPGPCLVYSKYVYVRVLFHFCVMCS